MIPPAIGSCTKLEYLRLDHNALEGRIPDSLCKCPSLRVLNLNCNRISGPIPWSLCFYCDALEELYVGANCLSGPLPDSIGQCRNLRIISAPSNRLSGQIPQSLAQLPQLQSLCLFPNYFDEAHKTAKLLKRSYGENVMFKVDEGGDEDDDVVEMVW